MCGVIAISGVDSHEIMNRLGGVASLEHRGIRSRTEYGSGWAMKHVRLPIVGIQEEHDQPILTKFGAVGFVGGLVDFREKYGSTFECDTDLVRHIWCDEGPTGFQRHDGFWHIVSTSDDGFWMEVLVDYLGQKPAYVRVTDRYAAIASELEPLVAMSPVLPDMVYMSSVMKWGYCPDVERTPYVGVSHVPPGEYWRIRPGDAPQVSKVDRIVPRTGSSPKDLAAAVVKSVDRRIMSTDVPVACLVSGGLDSSVVYSIASMDHRIEAYHVENGESEYASMVAPSMVRISPGYVGIYEAMGWMQEPIDLGSLVPQAEISHAIRSSGSETVCLTGDGADELFGGYGRASRYDSQASDVWQELTAWHLPRLDRVMMKNTIEVRSPFLSRDVVEIAMGLPWSVRRSKEFLREAFRGLVCSEVLNRPKVPLRTKEVENDREGRSVDLVRHFIEDHWGSTWQV